MRVVISWNPIFSFKRRGEVFLYPVNPAPRTAVLVPWFEVRPDWSGWSRLSRTMGWPRRQNPSGPVRIFADGWSAEAAAFSPSAIAATPSQLRLLASVEIPSLRHAVVALTRPDESRLSSADREQFWAIFRVPVFEQVIGNRGRLLACECEAHAGLHIRVAATEVPKLDPTGSASPNSSREPRPASCKNQAAAVQPTTASLREFLADGWIDESPCACGLALPRLVAASRPADLVRSVAAYAR